MGTPIPLIRAPVISTRKTLVQINVGADSSAHEWREIEAPIYAPSPRGADLASARVAADMGLGMLARAMGLSVWQISGLEVGSWLTTAEGWSRLFETIAVHKANRSR